MDSVSRISGVIAFLQTAKLGSFTAAAKLLDVTPAAISKNIASLEQTLGVRLMNRTTRSLSLTAEGEQFLSQVLPAIKTLDNAFETITTNNVPSGLVRISVANVIGRKLIMPIIRDLLACFPELKIEIDFEDKIIDFVQEGYDLVIRAGNITDSSMISRQIGSIKRCLVASPAYLKKRGIPQNPSDLSRHNLIFRKVIGNRIVPWKFIQPDDSVYILEPTSSILTLSDPGVLVDAALDGIGIAETAIYLSWEHIKKGDLKLVLFDQHDPGDYQVMIQYPHRMLIAPRVKVTADFIQNSLKDIECLNTKKNQLIPFMA